MYFERVSTFPGVNLPVRATTGAAGYDFECAANMTIAPHTIALIPTGIKAKIDHGYYLQLALRSSAPKKKGLMLANGIGIVDEDYWGPDSALPDEQGHIMFQVYNFTDEPVTITNGERIGQGVFLKYHTTINDLATGERSGRGFGSTGSGHISSEEDPNTGDF
jgi:dUTP pyrophosphatase